MPEISRTRPSHPPASSALLRNRVLRKVLLGNLQDAAEAIERCTDGRDMRAVFALPALRNELLESLALMADSARGLGAEDRACMPAVDWAAWDTLDLLQAGPARARAADDDGDLHVGPFGMGAFGRMASRARSRCLTSVS